MNKKQLTEKYYDILNENWFVKYGGQLLKALGLGSIIGAGAEAGSQAIEKLGGIEGVISAVSDKKPQRQVSPERVEALASGDKAANIRSLASPEFQNMGINQRTSTVTRERALARNLAKAELAKAKAAGDKDAIEKYTKAFKDLETGPMNLQPVEVRGSQSAATQRGRMAQRGVNIFQQARSVDDANQRAAAERDIEREGPLTGFKDRVEVMKGMEERGYKIGAGDDDALFKEREAAKKEANAEFEKLAAKYPDGIPDSVLDAWARKRNQAVDSKTKNIEKNVGTVNPNVKMR
jgi:predicted RNA-binding protein YlxR (DUF448 family)